MVPQHGPFSLHTMLEGPRLHITAFPTLMVWPLDESQGSTPLQGHGSWLMCEVALSAYFLHSFFQMLYFSLCFNHGPGGLLIHHFHNLFFLYSIWIALTHSKLVFCLYQVSDQSKETCNTCVLLAFLTLNGDSMDNL